MHKAAVQLAPIRTLSLIFLIRLFAFHHYFDQDDEQLNQPKISLQLMYYDANPIRPVVASDLWAPAQMIFNEMSMRIKYWEEKSITLFFCRFFLAYKIII